MSGWKVGDRVTLLLPYEYGVHGRKGQKVRVAGTVTGVDTIPGQPGVAVHLDHSVNRADTCYASHRELRRAQPTEGNPA